MITIEHVLFPTDFSNCAEQALRQAAYIARTHGAKLTLLHVVVPYMGESREADEDFPGEKKLDEILSELEAEARGSLDRHADDVTESGFEVERMVVRAFSASDKIVSIAKSQNVDLIVMGTHGRRGFSRVILGSEAERVLRFAPCSVLTVSDKAGEARLPEKVLVPIDFSESSDLAMRYAYSVAKEFGASVDVAHVFDEPVVPPFLMDHTASILSADPKMKDRCLASMTEKIAENGIESVPTEMHVLEGRIAPTLRSFVKDRGSDLLVVGTRGLSGLDYMLLGSTASHLIRTAPCAVLTVKLPGDGED